MANFTIQESEKKPPAEKIKDVSFLKPKMITTRDQSVQDARTVSPKAVANGSHES